MSEWVNSKGCVECGKDVQWCECPSPNRPSASCDCPVSMSDCGPDCVRITQSPSPAPTRESEIPATYYLPISTLIINSDPNRPNGIKVIGYTEYERIADKCAALERERDDVKVKYMNMKDRLTEELAQAKELLRECAKLLNNVPIKTVPQVKLIQKLKGVVNE